MLMYSSFHILDDNFNEFVIIYSLYFVFHYLYRGRLLLFFFFKTYIGFTNLRIE